MKLFTKESFNADSGPTWNFSQRNPLTPTQGEHETFHDAFVVLGQGSSETLLVGHGDIIIIIITWLASHGSSFSPQFFCSQSFCHSVAELPFGICLSWYFGPTFFSWKLFAMFCITCWLTTCFIGYQAFESSKSSSKSWNLGPLVIFYLVGTFNVDLEWNLMMILVDWPNFWAPRVVSTHQSILTLKGVEIIINPSRILM